MQNRREMIGASLALAGSSLIGKEVVGSVEEKPVLRFRKGYCLIKVFEYKQEDNELVFISYLEEWGDGTSYWYLNNVIHRENDLPAVVYANGDKFWYSNGELHRGNDLPAIERANGTKHWCLEGKRHRENDLPAVVYANGDKEWYLNGELHRENDLPAIERVDGLKSWYLNNKLIKTVTSKGEEWIY